MTDIREHIAHLRLFNHKDAADAMERLLAEQQRLEGALGLSMAREVRQSAVVEAARPFQYVWTDDNSAKELEEALAALDQTKQSHD